MSVPTLDFLGCVAHERIDEPLIDSFRREQAYERMAKHVPTTHDLPFTSFHGSLEMVMDVPVREWRGLNLDSLLTLSAGNSDEARRMSERVLRAGVVADPVP